MADDARPKSCHDAAISSGPLFCPTYDRAGIDDSPGRLYSWVTALEVDRAAWTAVLDDPLRQIMTRPTWLLAGRWILNCITG